MNSRKGKFEGIVSQAILFKHNPDEGSQRGCLTSVDKMSRVSGVLQPSQCLSAALTPRLRGQRSNPYLW